MTIRNLRSLFITDSLPDCGELAPLDITDIDELILSKIDLFSPGPEALTFVHYLLQCYTKTVCMSTQSPENKQLHSARKIILNYIFNLLSIPSMCEKDRTLNERGSLLLFDILFAMHQRGGSLLPTVFSTDLNDLVLDSGCLDSEDSFVKVIVDNLLHIKNSFKKHSLDKVDHAFSLIDFFKYFITLSPCIMEIFKRFILNVELCSMELASFASQSYFIPMLSIGVNMSLGDLKPPQNSMGFFAKATSSPSEEFLNLQYTGLEDANAGNVSLDGVQAYLQRQMLLYQVRLFDLFYVLIKSSLKTDILAYFVRLFKANTNRGKMHYEKETVSGDSVLWNSLFIWLQFCKPFLVLGNKKIGNIQISDLLGLGPSSFLKDLWPGEAHDFTRWNASEADWISSKDLISQKLDGSSPKGGFISDSYFFCLELLRLVISSFLNQYTQLKEIVEEMRASLSRGQEIPPIVRTNIERQIGRHQRFKLWIECQLYSPAFLAFSSAFFSFSVEWMLSILNYAHDPGTTDVFIVTNFLPEWLLDLIADFYEFILTKILHNYPKAYTLWMESFLNNSTGRFNTLATLSGDIFSLDIYEGINWLPVSVINLFSFVLDNGFVKNPYCKSKLMNVIYQLSFIDMEYLKGRHAHMVKMRLFSSSSLSLILRPIYFHRTPVVSLVKCIIEFYSAIEDIGTSSGFYDKFSIRAKIAHVAHYFFSRTMSLEFEDVDNDGQMYDIAIEPLEDALHALKQIPLDQMIRFVHLLLNDFTYLLDESIAKIGLINSIDFPDPGEASGSHQDSSNVAGASASTRPVETNRYLIERQATSLTSLSNLSLKFMSLLTVECHPIFAPIFLNDILLDRFTALLNYHLLQLLNPSVVKTLKVANPRKYYFQPRNILKGIVMIYLAFMEDENAIESSTSGLETNSRRFMKSCLRDKRSFEYRTFRNRVIVLANKYRFLNESVVVKWVHYLDLFGKSASSSSTATSLDLEDEDNLPEDTPDNYIDPLMATLMVNPVLLPTSGVIVDKSTILKHLLNNKTDPFNRKPLTIADIIPQDDLHREILAWKRSKK